ncbi:MAG: hypothetical protein NVS3B10_13730 [Polyangiales bacterium]
MHRAFVVPLVLASLVLTTAAHAQSGAKKEDATQVMVFPDADTLMSMTSFPSESKIGAGHGPIRVLLVRPRVSFVPEMYKSIENL